MPVPKQRHTSTSRDMRRSHHKLNEANLAVCPQCHEPKMPHRVCASCGYYKGREIVDTE